MSEKDYYPAGAYNDPNAPYNQPDPIEDTDVFADKRQELIDERVKDINGYLIESIAEAGTEFLVKVAVIISSDMPDDKLSDQILGAAIREQVIKYCTPPDFEVIEALEAENDI